MCTRNLMICAVSGALLVAVLGGVCLGQARPTAPAAVDATQQALDQCRKRIADLEESIRQKDLQIAQLDREKRLLELRLQAALGGRASAPVTPVTPAAPVTPVTPAASPAGPEPELLSITFPPRKVTAMGLVVKSETRLAAITGGKELQFVPAKTADATEGVALGAGASAAVMTFSCKHATRGQVTVASLELKGDGLYWTWLGFSPDGLADGLTRLDETLKSAAIEVLAAGGVLARCQAAPAELEVAFGRPVAKTQVPVCPAETLLRIGPAPEGWTIEETQPNQFSLTQGEQTLVLTFDVAARILKGEWVNLSVSKVKGIEDQIRVCEENNKSLEESVRLDPSDRIARDELLRSRRQLADLQKEKAKVLSDTTRESKPNVSSLKATLVLPNSVALYKLTFKVN